MQITLCRSDLPEWAMNNMKMICDYCGSYIVDNGDKGGTTARWCCNPACPGHLCHKAKELANFFNIKGFGPATALQIIKLEKYTNHFQFIPRWFKDKKPLLTLPEIAVLACIEGYGAPTANKELSHYASFTEYFNTVPFPNPLLVSNKETLLYAETLFAIKPPVAQRKMFVMGTGSFHGYNNREEYFSLLNDAYGAYINVIQTGKRKTGISYLIKELDAVDHSKSKIAKECGIPIVTPTEFLSIIASMCPYIDEG